MSAHPLPSSFSTTTLVLWPQRRCRRFYFWYHPTLSGRDDSGLTMFKGGLLFTRRFPEVGPLGIQGPRAHARLFPPVLQVGWASPSRGEFRVAPPPAFTRLLPEAPWVPPGPRRPPIPDPSLAAPGPPPPCGGPTLRMPQNDPSASSLASIPPLQTIEDSHDKVFSVYCVWIRAMVSLKPGPPTSLDQIPPHRSSRPCLHAS